MTAALAGHLPDSASSRAFPLFRELAERLELPRVEHGGRLVIRLRAGEIGFSEEGSRFAWFAAEKSEAEAARRILRDRWGFGRRETSVTAYWSAARDDAAG